MEPDLLILVKFCNSFDDFIKINDKYYKNISLYIKMLRNLV
jgi:hypothetical protein